MNRTSRLSHRLLFLALAFAGLAPLAFAASAHAASFSDVTAPPLGDPAVNEGIAWADYDNNGTLDMYVVTIFGTSRLFSNMGASVFEDVTTPPLDVNGVPSAVAWGDYDNDADQDLLVAVNGGGPTRLFENNGGFTDVPGLPPISSVLGAAWLDYDKDGLLDVYLSTTGVNRLLHNDGGGSFSDFTSPPLDAPGDGRGVAAVDYDDDGDTDLFLINFQSPARLFENDGTGIFTDVTPLAFPGGEPLTGFASAWGDHDNDGDMDLFVARSIIGNLLYENNGGVFTDVTPPILQDLGLNSFQASWIDYDNDGLLDLYVVNDVPGSNHLFRNLGGGSFVDDTSPPLDNSVGASGQGAAWADYDLDGLLDVFLGNDGPNLLLHNDDPSGNNFLHVTLVGTTSNRSGIGARVRVTTPGLVQTRQVTDGGHRSQDSRTVEFGLGANAVVNQLEIRWPSGTVDVLTNVSAGQNLAVLEGSSPAALTISHVTPNTARVDGQITLRIFGDQVDIGPPSVLQLEGPGGVLLPTTVFTTASGFLDAEFNFTEEASGAYFLILANAGGLDTLEAALVLHNEAVDLTRATTLLSVDRFPDLGWDGDSLAFASDRAGGSNIFTKHPAIPDGLTTQLTFTGEGEDPSWAPDGSAIVFTEGTSTLSIVDISSGVVTPQPIGSTALRPSWSPRGDLIAYDNTTAVFTVEPNSDLTTQVTFPPAGTFHVEPDWSPDGANLVFILNDSGVPGSGLAVAPADGSVPPDPVVPESGDQIINPAWSPDGQWIAFASDAAGNFDIYLVRSTGGAVIQITSDPATDFEPSWGTDNTSLLFVSTRGGVEDVYIATSLPISVDTDGDLVPDVVDACPTLAPVLGEIDRDFDGCPDPTSSFRQVRFWSDNQFPVAYETDAIGDPSIGDGSDFQAIADGFNAWASVSGITVSGADNGLRGGPSVVVNGDGRNSISFSDPAGFKFNTIGITLTTVAEDDTVINGRWYRPGETVDSDILVNTQNYTFSTPSFPGTASSYDLRTFFTHEFGHFVGLAHSFTRPSTMFYVLFRGTAQQVLGTDDLTLSRRGYANSAPALSVEGQVLRGEDGVTPVVGAAMLAISAATGDSIATTFTGLDGTYRFYELPEDVYIFTAPIDGGPTVNGLRADGVNDQLASVAETNFLAEFYDLVGESNGDAGTGSVIAAGSFPFTGADILTNLDLSAPQVVFTNPPDLGIDFPITGAISIKFSEGIEKNTITNASFALTNTRTSIDVAGDAGVLQLDSLLVFTPTNALEDSTIYSLRIGPGIEDKFQNAMPSAVTITFTTADPETISLASASPTEVPVGGSLVLTGTGFSTVPSENLVTFTDGVSTLVATPTASSPVQLFLTVPVGAPSGQVYASRSGNDSNSLPITILPPRALPTGTPLGQASLAGDPLKLSMSPSGAYAFVATSAGVSVVDAFPNSDNFLDVDDLPITGGATGVVAMPDGLRALAVSTSPPQLHVIDADPNSTLFPSIVQSVSLVEAPLGIAVVPGGSRVLISYASRVVAHDAAPGPAFGLETREWLQMGIAFLGDIAVSADGAEAFATSGGQVAVLGLAPGEGIVGTYPAGTSPSELAGVPAADSFLGVDLSGNFRKYGKRGPVLNTLTYDGGYQGLTVSPEGAFAYAANFILNRIEVFDLAAAPNQVSSIATGVDPTDITTGSAGRYIYVCTDSGNQLEVYDTETGPVISYVSPAAGGTGTLVTLVGSGFDPVAANNLVSFGGTSVAAQSASVDGTALTAVQPSGAASPVSVKVTGEVSNTFPYKVVNRYDAGAFLATGTIQDTDIGFMQRMTQSPDGKKVFGIRTDGSMVAIQGDPVPTNFLRKVQDRISSETGLTSAGDMVVTPDGKKLYVLDGASGEVAVFDVGANGATLLSRLGSVQDSTASDAVLDGDELAVLPDGSRLLVRSESNNTIWEVDIATDILLAGGVGDAINDFQAFPFSMAVDPRGTFVYAGDNDAVSPVLLGFDLDPGSPTYRQATFSVPLGAAGTSGPTGLTVSPDGNRLTCLVGQPLALSLQYNGVNVDIDPNSATYLQITAISAIALDVEPILSPNHSGSVLFALDAGQLLAFNPVTLTQFSSGPFSARMNGSADVLLSLDDARIYVQDGGGGIYLTDVSASKAFNFVSGQTQTGVVGQPLPASIVVQGSTADPTQLEGGVYVFSSPNGDFGFGDQLLYRAADSGGAVSGGYTAGASAGEDTVTVRAGFSSINAFLTILADTSLVPPEVLSVLPNAASAPGVNTTVAADFSKAINPATVNSASFIVRAPGGPALPGIYTFANGQRRVVFKPSSSLQYGAPYEIELTTALQDYSANPLNLGGGSGVFTFTTQAAPALALNAVNPSSAKVGAPVVLSGTGFGATPAQNQVLFGSIAVQPSTADPGALTVTVPNGATTGTVQVVVGGTASNAFPFTVLVPDLVPVNQVVNQIPVPSSGQQIAVLPNGTRAYMTSSGANTAVPINLATGIAETAIGVGVHPYGVAASPTSDRVFVSNFYSNTISVIDADPSHTSTFHTVIATIPTTGQNPAGIVMHPDGRTLYVVNYGDSSLDFIDTDSSSVTYNAARANVPLDTSSGSVAVTPDGATLIVGTATGIVLLDPGDGSARANVPLDTSAGSIAVTPDGAYAVVLTVGNVLWLIDVQPGTPDADRARSNVPLDTSAGSVAVSPDGAFVYVTTANNQVLVYQIISLGGSAASEAALNILFQFQLVASVRVDENPIGLAFDLNTKTLLVVNSGSKTISFINASEVPTGPVPTLVDLDPNTLNLGSKGNYISGHLQFPVYVDPMQILLSSVLLDSTVAADTTQLSFTDKNMDGILEAAIKFPRPEVIAMLVDGGEIVLHVTGIVEGREFAGEDTITVKAPKLKKPLAGAVLPPGQSAAIEWSPSPLGAADHLDIYWTQNGGEQWDTVVVETPDDSTHVWSVPDVESGQCRLMLVAYDHKDEIIGTTIMEGVFSISAAQIGVEETLPARLAFLPALPNPFRAQTEIRFELPEASAVTIRVFGLDGSLVRTLARGVDFPAGRHGIVWDGSNEHGQRTGSGVYFLRMETPKQTLVQKVVRIQK